MDPDLFAVPARHDLHRALEEVADATLLIDNHAHPFWLPDVYRNGAYALPPLANVLTEATPVHAAASSAPASRASISARGTLSFCRSLKDMHALLVPNPPRTDSVTSESVSDGASQQAVAAREEGREHGLDSPAEVERAIEHVRTEMGVWNLAKRCFDAAGIAAVLIDDGLSVPPGLHPVQLTEMQHRLNVTVVRRVLRLEAEAEKALIQVVTANEHQLWRRQPGVINSDKRPRTMLRARQFLTAFRAKLDPLPQDVVAFKSIAAYRGGLNVRLNWSDEDLEDALSGLSIAETSPNLSIRLQDRVIVDCVVREGLQAARRHGIPIQFHCGFGDTDLDLHNANPVFLRHVFEAFPDVAIVLLHAAWPYTRQAAYLASVYPLVYLDVGLAIPLLSVRGMFRAVDEALEIAPVTKLLYSSDAHSVPDAFYLAARWGRRIIAAVVAACVASGDLEQSEAKAAIRKILAENAVRLYKLPLAE